MNPNISLTSEDFFAIRFLRAQDFFQMDFGEQTYDIIAKDDVGNFIGIASDGCVIYLDTMYQGDARGLVYIAKDIETFIKEIHLYDQYGETPYPDHPTEEFLETYETDFRELVTALDADAFCNENAFWSTVAEEMGYGVI